jgi:hypothetical protein
VSPLDTLRDLAASHPELARRALELHETWSPEPVPLTVALAELADVLVTRSASFTDGDLDSIARIVESHLADPGPAADAMATGFLEAVSARSASTSESVARLVSRLGRSAQDYIRAWDRFTGATTPGVAG